MTNQSVNISPQSSRPNIGWIDLLRILACVLVVFSHCCDGFVAQFDNDRSSFVTGVLLGSLVRPCVPLFVMMTGVLLLPVGNRHTLTGFYRRRIGRIVPPLIFWSIALPVLAYLYFHYASPASANPSVNIADYTTPDTMWHRITTFIFNFNFDSTPLWYIYMLIGLYLIIPIIDKWLDGATEKDIRVVLWIWGLSLLLPYVKMLAPALGYQGNYGNYDILGNCDWNSYGTFYYFSGFIGYLMLAFYLVRFPLKWSRTKTLAICIPMFLTGYAITAGGYLLTQEYYPGNYAYLEIVWFFAGINVFMMTFPIFVLAQRLRIPSFPWLSQIAGLTFGVYLCHFVFVFVSYDLFNRQELPYVIRIAGMTVTTFAMAALVSWLFSRSRITSRFVK